MSQKKIGKLLNSALSRSTPDPYFADEWRQSRGCIEKQRDLKASTEVPVKKSITKLNQVKEQLAAKNRRNSKQQLASVRAELETAKQANSFNEQQSMMASENAN